MRKAIWRPGMGSERRVALALVCFTLAPYLGLARNVRWPWTACSTPRTPEISRSSSPCRRQPSAAASSLSFIVVAYWMWLTGYGLLDITQTAQPLQLLVTHLTVGVRH